MIRTRPLIALVAVSVLGVAACGGGRDGESLPDVGVEPLAGGEPVSLAELEGPAVVNLWATWCAPCRAEIPDFETVHQARGDAIRFVGINIGEDPADAEAFIAEVGATYDQFLDDDGEVVTALETSAMPVTLVIDADEVVTTRHEGAMNEATLDIAIDDALGI